jgi:O-antigen ligase
LAVLSILLFFASSLGFSYFVLGIILVRPSCDWFFDLAKSAFGEGFGPGAAVNVLIIGLGLLCFLQNPGLQSRVALPIWTGCLVTASTSAVLSPEPIAAARGLVWLATYFAMFSLPFALVRSPEWAFRCLTTALYSSFIPVAFALVEVAFGHAAVETGGRLQSTFAHPNIFAFYLVGVLALSMFMLKSTQISLPSKVRRLLVLYLPILIFLILLTETRSAWIACTLILTVFAGLVDRRYLPFLILLPLIVFIPGVEERILDVSSGAVNYRSEELDSYAWRRLLWENTFDWMASNPALLLGNGLYSFKHYAPTFFPLPDNNGDIIVAHNAFLQVYFEMGLLGILTFGWLFISLFWKLKDGYRSDSGGTLIMMAFALSFLVECYSDNMFDYLVYEWFFWFIMGTICAWNRLRTNPQMLQPAFAR